MPVFNSEALLILLLKMGAMYLVLRVLARGIWLRALVWWPATFVHEMAHLLLGVVFRADPVDIALWPKRVPGTHQVTLGHVKFRRLTWWKALPVALAPLLLFPLGCYLVTLGLTQANAVWHQLLYGYAGLQCFVGCWPSHRIGPWRGQGCGWSWWCR